MKLVEIKEWYDGMILAHPVKSGIISGATIGFALGLLVRSLLS